MFKPEIEGVVMYIIDRETRDTSKPVPIEDVIYDQHDIEFEFDDGGSLPYSDFLFCQEDYEVVVKVMGTTYGDE